MIFFQCGKISIKDADQDGLFIDDILRSNVPEKDKLNCSARYLTDIAGNKNVTANSNPQDPRQMMWQIGGKDRFALVKNDGALSYEEPSGDKITRVIKDGYGLLFNINPWFVQADNLKHVNPLAIRTAGYWQKKYKAAADKPILSQAEIKTFNEQGSEKVDRVDYTLGELPQAMKKKDVVELQKRKSGMYFKNGTRICFQELRAVPFFLVGTVTLESFWVSIMPTGQLSFLQFHGRSEQRKKIPTPRILQRRKMFG